jgi:phosphoglycolate phosphatase
MRYGLVLWDFDGTLADSLGCLLAIYNGLAAEHGFRPVDEPEAVRGLTALALLRRCGVPLARLPWLSRQILTAQRGRMTDIRLFPGVLDALQAALQSGCRMSVLSSNTEVNILACLRANQAEGLFESVVGYPRLFGKARAIRRLLKKAGLDGKHLLYVGDEVRDIEAARKAGVAAAAVTWGLNSPQLLSRHEPDFLIERPEQIPELLT